MKKLNNKITKALGLLFTGLMFSPNISVAALINFATQPLYVSTAVAPNLTVLLDDSGSMAYAYAPDSLSSYTSTRRFRASYYNPLAYNPSLTYLAPVNESNVSSILLQSLYVGIITEIFIFLFLSTYICFFADSINLYHFSATISFLNVSEQILP